MNDKQKNAARIITAAAACGFLLYGILRGEVSIVLNKAVNICFECIGLG